jgi:hypothetical protein
MHAQASSGTTQARSETTQVKRLNGISEKKL